MQIGLGEDTVQTGVASVPDSGSRGSTLIVWDSIWAQSNHLPPGAILKWRGVLPPQGAC